MKTAYIVATKDHRIYICSRKPVRWGRTQVINEHEYTYEKRDGTIGHTKLKVNNFQKADAMISIAGALGENELWDGGDDYQIGIYTITFDDCYDWAYKGQQYMEISEQICKKIFDIVPKWEDEPIAVEI